MTMIGDITRQTSTPTNVIQRKCSEVEVPVERRGLSHRFGALRREGTVLRQRQRALSRYQLALLTATAVQDVHWRLCPPTHVRNKPGARSFALSASSLREALAPPTWSRERRRDHEGKSRE